MVNLVELTGVHFTTDANSGTRLARRPLQRYSIQNITRELTRLIPHVLNLLHLGVIAEVI